METFSGSKIENIYGLSTSLGPLDFFERSFQFVKDHYKADLDRISSTKFSEITPDFFLREVLWVIHTSGFNAKIISKLFPALLRAYEPCFNFISFKTDVLDTEKVSKEALSVFGNKRKLAAILKVSSIIRQNIGEIGWEQFRDTSLNTPDKLSKLPFIGKITQNHLARNIGLLDFVKADLHLNRLAKLWDFDTPIDMCKFIQTKYELPLGIIDLVLFYAAAQFGSK